MSIQAMRNNFQGGNSGAPSACTPSSKARATATSKQREADLIVGSSCTILSAGGWLRMLNAGCVGQFFRDGYAWEGASVTPVGGWLAEGVSKPTVRFCRSAASLPCHSFDWSL